MDNPKVNQFYLARLYDKFKPVKIRVNSISESDPNVINITVYPKGDSYEKDVDMTKNGFRVFKESIDSKLYYTIISHEDDGYDNTNDCEVQTFMCVEEALNVCDELNQKNQNIDYDVIVYRFEV